MEKDNAKLIRTTAQIATSYFAHQTIGTGAVAAAITSIYDALAALGEPEVEPEIARRTPVVSVRASLKQDHLISLLDGRPYKTLTRHLAKHGFTPESYREEFGLPASYPMVAPSYARMRSELALRSGLGRRMTRKPRGPAVKK